VMTLPNATLFPHAMLPLYIFEERYKQMLTDVLEGSRMFSVAMRKSGSGREIPSNVAGVGLVRAAVRNKDGTANLILQGITRVELEPRARRVRPYRVHRVRPLRSQPSPELVVAPLMKHLGALVQSRLQHGMDLAGPLIQKLPSSGKQKQVKEMALQSMKEFAQHLTSIKDPGLFADMAACALISVPAQRQRILESVNIEERLRSLTEILSAPTETAEADDDCPF